MVAPLRDRDAIVTPEGIIFRVYGYTHPPEGYVCDAEYAHASIYMSNDPRALRSGGGETYYKFYGDEGLRFVRDRFPKYTLFYEPLGVSLVGVRKRDFYMVLKPEDRFKRLMVIEAKDPLMKALKSIYHEVSRGAGLSLNDFGVFGSILHGFYDPKCSDIDLIVYGRAELAVLKNLLSEMYGRRGSLRNEFDDRKSVLGKKWKFRNYSLKEYLEHQRRKLVYAIYSDEESHREIKVEFEPVKRWCEIKNDYDSLSRIRKVGWAKCLARVTEDSDTAFMPSVYGVQIIKVFEGRGVEDVVRINSYVEEFRMQANRDDLIYVEGNLEEVTGPKGGFHQITLTYCDRYYEQTLKVVS
ncbi:MAG: hypothetical protein QXL67_02675 [Candidatus Bathyarchaeia archaeon]